MTINPFLSIASNTHADLCYACDSWTGSALAEMLGVTDPAAKAEMHALETSALRRMYPVAVQALHLAGVAPATVNVLLRTLAGLVRFYDDLLTDEPDLINNSDGRAFWALLVARHAAAHLAEPFDHVGLDTRTDVVWDVFDRDSPDEQVNQFWTFLSEYLYRYSRSFPDTRWVPGEAVVPGDDWPLSMPVWEAPGDVLVCDLLMSHAGDNQEQHIANEVKQSFVLATQAYPAGPVAGIRVVFVASGEPTRLYSPRGSWVSEVESPTQPMNGPVPL
jgi:hypothetical protein